METKDQWLTIKETCEYLKVTRDTLYRWQRKGKVRFYRLVDKEIRLKRGELDKLLTPVNAKNLAAHRPQEAIAARQKQRVVKSKHIKSKGGK